MTTQHAAHTYAGPGGGFTVTLIVTDDDGETATATEQVDVSRGIRVGSPTSVIQHVTPNSQVSVPPTVYLYDNDGQPMPGVAVDFQATGGGSVGNTHAVSDEDGRASCGQWIVGAADGADTVVARIDGVPRAIFFARAATVLARYDLETIGGKPLPRTYSGGGRTWVIEGGRLFFWSDQTVTRGYILTGESFDSTQVSGVYRRNGDVLRWGTGGCADRRPRFRATESQSSQFLEDDEVYLRNYGTLSPPELPPDPAGIYLAGADGSNPRRLITGERPAWSPDGRRIAFQRNGNIRLIGIDGTGETLLGEGREPAWHPDGARLAFTSAEGIAVMREDGSGATTLVRHDFRDDTYAESDQGVGKPAWSPDGDRIAFEHRGDGDLMPAQIFVMNADGSDPRRVTSTPGGPVRRIRSRVVAGRIRDRVLEFRLRHRRRLGGGRNAAADLPDRSG